MYLEYPNFDDYLLWSNVCLFFFFLVKTRKRYSVGFIHLVNKGVENLIVSVFLKVYSETFLYFFLSRCKPLIKLFGIEFQNAVQNGEWLAERLLTFSQIGNFIWSKFTKTCWKIWWVYPVNLNALKFRKSQNRLIGIGMGAEFKLEDRDVVFCTENYSILNFL